MNERAHSSRQAGTPTRRQAISGVAIVLGSLAVGPEIWAAGQQPSMPEKPSTGADRLRTFLHQEVEIHATPQRIYEVLLDSKQFAAMTGLPAEIDPKVGGAFSTFGGRITGRNVEIILNQRIVQAWRPESWDKGIYSIVRFELKAQGPGTKIVLDHTGFPEGTFGGLNSGWPERYWEPMKKYFV